MDNWRIKHLVDMARSAHRHERKFLKTKLYGAAAEQFGMKIAYMDAARLMLGTLSAKYRNKMKVAA